ncbi:hypothetical protein JWG45_12175 [Leptospira sp. 201903070]|jgi:hypothetical protein|uniref:STAS/SEC14 domain-containing protein n=1 Tax=Leptospira ainlahdjerensis TaxID=2810033 RepID=A0ABS2UBZ9_9LEPT|nr:hypothetical protein [Leptospira ainlahdjerensis]MBM9577904.1 hypothetical protein [Leptospira ainlahdjerensis]
MTKTTTRWIPEKQLISTTISGKVEVQDVELWEKTLLETLEKIPDNGVFKIFVNLHGFEAANLEAHKRFRTIIPKVLSDYGWKVGYLNLFEESKQMQFRNLRGIRCIGAVHVHQDETKINSYEEKFGRDNEHFYTDPKTAEDWISNLALRV